MSTNVEGRTQPPEQVRDDGGVTKGKQEVSCASSFLWNKMLQCCEQGRGVTKSICWKIGTHVILVKTRSEEVEEIRRFYISPLIT